MIPLSPWLPRCPGLVVAGLWLVLPAPAPHQSAPVPVPEFKPMAGFASGTAEMLVEVEQLADPALWAELDKTGEFEARDENDSVIFRGTAAEFRRFLTQRPPVPADQPLLPTTGGP